MRSPRAISALLAVTLIVLAAASLARSLPTPRSRGEYLTTIMDCGGCHTGGVLARQPDPRLHLAGSGIGFGVPGLGVFYTPNLTPDRDTGLGGWGEAEVIRAIRTGVRPDGRVLVPVMPWHNYGALTDEDARALADYLRGLAPVRN